MNNTIYSFWVGYDFKLIKIFKLLIEFHNKNFILINENNISKYLKNIPECFNSLLPKQQSDYVKVNIMCEYGGIWLDLDVLVLSNLSSFFEILIDKDGFFFENTNNCFGTNPNTLLMLEWKRIVNEKININNKSIGMNELGFNLLKKIESSYFINYKIFNDKENFKPICKTDCVFEFLQNNYYKYKNIEKENQPLIFLNSSVIVEYEKMTEKNKNKSPLQYFINKSQNKIIENKSNLYEDYFNNRKRLDIKILNKIKYDNNVNIAIIIPYRDRLENLKNFTQKIKNLKLKNNNSYDLYIIEQNNFDKFNRGLLLNIGFIISNKNFKYDRYIFHDVDTYPSQEIFDLYFSNIKLNIHYFSPQFEENKYKFSTFMGGIIGFTEKSFLKINGFPNNFFGWGGEDDAMYNRMVINNIEVYRPTDGYFEMDDNVKHSNSTINLKKKENILEDLKSWYKNGIKQVESYSINLKNQENIDNYKTLLINYKKNLSKINYFKINYLAMHTSSVDYFFKSNYIENNLKETMLNNPDCFHHSINKNIISVIEPLIYWFEIKEKIFDTYTSPKKFNCLNLPINESIKNLVNKEFDFYNVLTKQDLFDNIKFIFENYGTIIYIRIRNNKIECSYHISSEEKLIIDWSKYVKFNNKPIDKSIVSIYEENNIPYFTLKNFKFKKINNCLINLENKLSKGTCLPSYIKEFIEMINFTIEIFKEVPDCDFLINRSDFPLLRMDNKYSYTDLIDEIIPNPPKNYYPIFSQSKTTSNLDIPIPSSNEWSKIKLNEKYETDWIDKKNIAVFRGSSTGCCMNDKENSRIRLSQLSYDKVYGDKLNVCMNLITKRIKVCNKILQPVTKSFNHLLGDYMNDEEQSKYKYIFNIQGNSQAYRYPTEFNKKSVILGVESDYYMWFEKLLINHHHFIFIKKDFSNLGDELNFLTENDNNSKNIMENGYNFYKQFINKETIATYWFWCMYNLNNLNIQSNP
jgi:hypothetical protein